MERVVAWIILAEDVHMNNGKYMRNNFQIRRYDEY
jgi:hypothetical protein